MSGQLNMGLQQYEVIVLSQWFSIGSQPERVGFFVFVSKMCILWEISELITETNGKSKAKGKTSIQEAGNRANRRGKVWEG